MRFLFFTLLVSLLTLRAEAAPITPGFVRPGSSDTDHRTWTSSDGRKLLAELVEAREEEVVLLTPAKESFTVPVSRLSAADRDYIARWLEHRSHGIGYYQAGIFSREGLPESAHVRDVPHVRQRENYCATASAEMLLRFYGFDIDQRFLARISSEESRRGGGTGARALSVALRNIGLEVAILRPHEENPDETPFENLLNGIKRALAENRPVTMSYRTSGATSHMVVVVGYDDRRRSLYVLDPAGRSAPERILYKTYEDLLLRAMVPFPHPNAVSDQPPTAPDPDFLRQVSGQIRGHSLRPYSTTLRLREAGIDAQMRDVNRLDARSSQGLTRSFARQHGVGFVQEALDQGKVILAPQSFDTGNGLILIYGHANNQFQGVEYYTDGTFQRGETSLLQFSLRWMERRENLYLLYIVEITPPSS